MSEYMDAEAEDQQFEEFDPQTKPADLPSVSPKPGYKTSQGQLTVVFGLISFIGSLLGWHFSVEQIDNLYQLINNAITILGPLMAFIPVLVTYINSRGKIQSNAMNASAGMALGLSGKFDIGKLIKGVAGSGIIPGPAGSIVESILGGDSDNSELLEVAKNHEGRIRKLEGK